MNLAILTGRVLKDHMPFFATFGAGLEKHIAHLYNREMSQKSEVVCRKTTIGTSRDFPVGIADGG